ncbi:MAG: Na(+)-translocating NADH-quinone reductase subunit A [Alphaproteobacteria bacterium]|nr:Na(+)-translocating NADH-quinone reductase subunit A [Alphaproteobacteria bacterium]
MPAPSGPVPVQITEEAGLTATWDEDFRVEALVAEGDRVAQGAPVLRSRRYPEIVVTAPMAARVAKIGLNAGRRLSRIVFYGESDAGRHEFDTNVAKRLDDSAAVRLALQQSGLWRHFRSRPFGQEPRPDESPMAIVVMARDTRPAAPDPRLALAGRESEFERGLRALLTLGDGPVYVCQAGAADLVDAKGFDARLRIVRNGGRHPWGLAGFQIHQIHPAAPGKPVWDLHAEDVAGIGAYLETGLVPETRLISVTGSALRQQRHVRCQPGADLRGLSHGFVKPGRHTILSGSALDGHEARWLGLRHRQATVISGDAGGQRRHWFLSALRGASRPLPIIPTAALDHAMGGALPAAAFLRALSAGDTETAVKLGALSFLAEDMALVDYVTGAEPRFSEVLSAVLERIEQEEIG